MYTLLLLALLVHCMVHFMVELMRLTTQGWLRSLHVILERIRPLLLLKDVMDNAVMVYMKEEPALPRCGFSSLAVRVLNEYRSTDNWRLMWTNSKPCISIAELQADIICNLENYGWSGYLVLCLPLQNDISDILDLTFSIDADEEKIILYERAQVCTVQHLLVSSDIGRLLKVSARKIRHDSYSL